MNRTYLARRTGQAVMTVVIVVTIAFLLTRLLPGGPWLLECLPGGGECEIPPDATAGMPLPELVIMLGFIAVLFVVAAAIQGAFD